MAVVHLLILMMAGSCILATTNSLDPADVCSQNHPTVNCHCWSIMPGTINYDCSNKELTVVPEAYSNQAITLSFKNNLITAVKRGVLNNLFNLRELDFTNNLIDTIEPGTFDRMMKLAEIHLVNNRLTSIHKDMFRHLPALELVNLTNNQISTVGRYAFFTTPSLLSVDLKNNPVQCNCEEKLLRQFVDFTKRTFMKNTVCANLGNQNLMTLQNSQFPDCPSGESLFPPARSRYCYACSAVTSLKECATKQQAQCFDSNAVCYNQLQFTNTLQVNGGCSDYNNCALWEKQNMNTCVEGGSYVSCYVCYHNSLSNKDDLIDLMKTFTMVAKTTFFKVMTPGLRDTTSNEYIGFTSNLKTQFYNLIYGLNGSYSVTFVRLTEQPSASNVVAEFLIECSTMWFISKASVLSRLRTTLLDSRLQGEQIIIVDVYLDNQTDPICPLETMPDPVYGTITWPRTVAGASSIVRCPYQLDSVSTRRTASRACIVQANGGGRWGSPNMTGCPKADETSRQLENLANTDITEDNVEKVSSDVKALSTEWHRFESEEVTWSVDIIDGIVKTDSSATSRTVVGNTLQIINSVLFVEKGVLSESQTDSKSSSRLVTSINTLVDRIAVDGNSYRQVTPNIAALVNAASVDNFAGLTMSFQASNLQLLTDDRVTQHQADTAPPSGYSGITVPRTVFDGLSGRVSNTVTKISSFVIREPKIFQTIDAPKEKEIVLSNNETVKAAWTINSNVIGTSVPGVVIRNLIDPVRIVFQHHKEAVSPVCVYWDSSMNSWKSDGCVVNATSEVYTVCHCNHLTNFALLMDVYGTGGGLSAGDKLALAVISYIGCGLSLVAVGLTICTYLMFKKLRRDNPSKILMNLCLAIGLVDLVFVVGMQDYSSGSPAGCKIVAILLHYFLLAALFWMAVEAFYMYLALVKVFDTYIARFQLKSSLFGWGLPLLIVVVTIAVNKSDNYGVQPGGICWLDRIPFYVAFLAPVCIVLVLNTISFVLVIRQISRRSSNKLTKTDKSSTAVRLRGAISLIVLLGLTWLFGILAVDNYGLVFHYLFAIFNSLQGFFIFIFYCVLKKEAQQCWRRKLPCLKSAYEQSTTSSGTNKDYSQSSSTYANDKSSVSELPGDGRTDSTDMSSSSRANEAKSAPKESKFRGNWQYVPGGR